MFTKEEQASFLRHIAEDEEDEARRLIYADWLDENGMEDEATRQRKWKKARDWLIAFARKWNFFDCTGNCGDFIYHNELAWNDPRRYEHVPGTPLSNKEIIDQITVCTYLVAMGKDLHGADELGKNHDLFWENLEIVTGNQYHEETKENFGWSCSC